MKIAFFLSSFPVLSETFILNQITGLLGLGHQVDIYVNSINKGLSHPDVQSFNLLERVHLHGHVSAINPKGKSKKLLKAARILAESRNGFLLPLLRSLNVFKYGRSALTLNLFFGSHALQGQAYDIIYCHFGPNGSIGARFKEIGALRGKLVTTFHGYDLSSYLHFQGKEVYSSLFQHGDAFLPISRRWKDTLLEMGCPAEKTFVHRMGIDLSRFCFRPRFPVNDGKVRLFTVARLVEKKGVRYAIEAVARILPEFPNLQYVIAGDGPLRSKLLALAGELGVHRNVELVGWQGQDAIAEYMQQSDILLCPSVTDRNGDQEGIPVVLMEAMAQGLPVLSTFHSGIPELVVDGKNGFLVQEKDAAQMAEKLRFLLDNPGMWEEMGRAARDHIEEQYDIVKLNQKLVGIFSSLL
ncbi:MAG: glycosyltransferase [Desulfovibrionales bacterium]